MNGRIPRLWPGKCQQEFYYNVALANLGHRPIVDQRNPNQRTTLVLPASRDDIVVAFDSSRDLSRNAFRDPEEEIERVIFETDNGEVRERANCRNFFDK